MAADEDQVVAFIPVSKITPAMDTEQSVTVTEHSFYQQTQEEEKRTTKAGKRGSTN